MTSENKRYLLTTVSGAIAGLLGLPFIAGIVQLPSFVLVCLPGVIFSLIVLTAIRLIYPATRLTIDYRSWLSSAAALVIGMPVALVAGFAVLNVADHFVPGTHYQFGGIGISFVIAELASCAIWSLFLCLCLYMLYKARFSSLLLPSLATTISIMIVMNILYAVSTIFLQRSVPLTFTSIAEQMASALILAIGIAKGADAVPRTGIAASS
jgi:hypothetical protein